MTLTPFSQNYLSIVFVLQRSTTRDCGDLQLGFKEKLGCSHAILIPSEFRGDF